jgi:RNA polymerase sigma-70 factor (ECF subfamily)
VDEHPVDIAIATDKTPRVVEGRRRARSAADPDELELIQACRRGDRGAMELLYHRYKRRVFGLAHRIAGAADAEEVAQDVFVRIFRGLSKFRGDSALGTWIYRLSVNSALSHVTRRKRNCEPEDALAAIPAPAAPESDPSMRERLAAALDALPPGYRAVLVLHDMEGLSHDECAEILGCRVGTSKSQLHKARAKMRELLGPELEAERRSARGEEGA